jgi:hypothetical protein
LCAERVSQPTGRQLAGILGYHDELLEGAPEESIESFAGTGNPFAGGELAPGATERSLRKLRTRTGSRSTDRVPFH